jgi:hypothetical protein
MGRKIRFWVLLAVIVLATFGWILGIWDLVNR